MTLFSCWTRELIWIDYSYDLVQETSKPGKFPPCHSKEKWQEIDLSISGGEDQASATKCPRNHESRKFLERQTTGTLVAWRRSAGLEPAVSWSEIARLLCIVRNVAWFVLGEGFGSSKR